MEGQSQSLLVRYTVYSPVIAHPKTITLDGSEAIKAAIKSSNAKCGTHIAIRQVKY